MPGVHERVLSDVSDVGHCARAKLSRSSSSVRDHVMMSSSSFQHGADLLVEGPSLAGSYSGCFNVAGRLCFDGKSSSHSLGGHWECSQPEAGIPPAHCPPPPARLISFICVGRKDKVP